MFSKAVDSRTNTNKHFYRWFLTRYGISKVFQFRHKHVIEIPCYFWDGNANGTCFGLAFRQNLRIQLEELVRRGIVIVSFGATFWLGLHDVWVKRKQLPQTLMTTVRSQQGGQDKQRLPGWRHRGCWDVLFQCILCRSKENHLKEGMQISVEEPSCRLPTGLRAVCSWHPKTKQIWGKQPHQIRHRVVERLGQIFCSFLQFSMSWENIQPFFLCPGIQKTVARDSRRILCTRIARGNLSPRARANWRRQRGIRGETFSTFLVLFGYTNIDESVGGCMIWQNSCFIRVLGFDPQPDVETFWNRKQNASQQTTQMQTMKLELART